MRNHSNVSNDVHGVMRAKSKMVLLSTTAFIASALFVPTQAEAATLSTPTNSWDYDVILDGNVAKDVTVLGITDITVTGGNGFVEGNADIYTGHSVTVTGDSGATFAYRDNRANIQSTLDGDLTSNMKIVIIDKDGLFFADGSVIDVQGLVATSSDISVVDIMDGGDLSFANVGDGGSVTVNGSITVAEAGLAAFVSPFITSRGMITAKMGNVVMAAGDAVTLDLYGDGLVEVVVDGELADALIENENMIIADGGYVQITAKAAKATIDNIVNNTGIIDVTSATVEGGKIILSSGDHGSVKNAGLLVTSDDGEVNISGERFVQDIEGSPEENEAKILAFNGDVNIKTTGNVEIYNGYIDANGGNIDIDNGGVFYSAPENTLRTSSLGTINLNQNKEAAAPLLLAPVFINDEDNGDTDSLYYVAPAASIQNAIDAINNTGLGTNTINVGAGIYNEAVRADHAKLILKGANAGAVGYGARVAETIIVPNSPGVHVTANGVTIDGFTILGGTPAIFVDGADNVSVINNIVDGATTDGIKVVNSDSALVAGNDIYNIAVNGIYAVNSGSLDIDANEVASAFTGIRVHNSNDAEITNNDIEDITGSDRFADGIHVDGGYDVMITGNSVYDVNDEGIYVNNSLGHLVVNGNDIMNVGLTIPLFGSGIEIINARGSAEVRDNYISDAQHGGIIFKNSRDGSGLFDVTGNHILGGIGASGIEIDRHAGIVSNNVVLGTGLHGIYISNSIGALISGNEISDTGVDGLRVVNSASALVVGNDIYDIAVNGIFVDRSNGIVIDDNEVSDAFTGVRVHNSDNAQIKNNDIYTITGNDRFADGIHVNGGFDVRITGNDIEDTNDEGIYVANSRGHLVVNHNDIMNVGLTIPVLGSGIELIYAQGSAEIRKNTIAGAQHGGILIKASRAGSGVFDITGNTISNVGVSGIEVDMNAGDVSHNTVSNTGKHGIHLVNSVDTLVKKNDIFDIGETGIYVTDFVDMEISNNDINHVGASGIYADNEDARGNGIEISHNKINYAGENAGGNGIYAWNIDDINIHHNKVKYVADGSGIDLGRYLDANVNKNKVSDVDGDGIFADGFNDDGLGLTVDLTKNKVKMAGGNGTQVGYTDDVYIADNDIDDVGNDGISVYNGSFVDIDDNKIRKTGGDGIEVMSSAFTTITMNDIKNIGFNMVAPMFALDEGDYGENSADGIHVENVDGYNSGSSTEVSGPEFNVVIENNVVDTTKDDGIEVVNSGATFIDDNEVYDAGDDGIRVQVSGSFNSPPPFAHFQVAPSLDYDGEPDLPTEIIISNNIVDNSADDGVEVDGTNVNLLVDSNEITNSGDNGILLITADGFNPPSDEGEGKPKISLLPPLGGGNGFDSTIIDNIVENSGSNGLYVKGSGHGDVILEGNSFIDNPTGASFESGNIDLTNIGNPNIFTVNDDFDIVPPVVGMRFDSLFGNDLSIVGNTLGATIFNGFIGRNVGDAYYVRIEDGTLLDTDTDLPIVIDGTFASWDGLVPDLFGNALPAPVLQALEDRLFDADDLALDGRGQIFVGVEEVIPANGPTNFQDFFPDIDFADIPGGGANLTILGLPFVAPFNLNDIAPAAGDDGNGDDPEELANIDPQAGDDAQQVTCIGDAMSLLSNGSVSYRFGGSFEESLAGASDCAATADL